VLSVFSVVRFLVPLEELDGALVLLGGLQALERAEVTPLAGLGIFLPGIEAITARG
jgi:hypothetical protein